MRSFAIDVHAEHLGQPGRRRLADPIGIAGVRPAAIAERDVEHAVGAEADPAGVVVGVLPVRSAVLVHREEPADLLGRALASGAARLALVLGDDVGVVLVGVVDEVAAVVGEVGMEGDAEQALLRPLGVHALADVEEGLGHCDAGGPDQADDARAFDHVQAALVLHTVVGDVDRLHVAIAEEVGANGDGARVELGIGRGCRCRLLGGGGGGRSRRGAGLVGRERRGREAAGEREDSGKEGARATVGEVRVTTSCGLREDESGGARI